jgi:phospholipid N-methyltransferase
MRTTVNLDEDVLEAGRAIARAEGRALGEVLSSLARRGLVPARPRVAEQDGFPVFEVEPGTGALTDQMVKAALEDL